MKISLKNRKIGYTYSSQSGIFSFRGIKEIAFESRLEKDFLTSFAFYDTVMDIEEQPFTLEYENEKGEIRTYTPDFMITYKDDPFALYVTKPLIAEIKPKAKLRKEFSVYKERFRAMNRYCQENDMRFEIFWESRIHTTYYKNVTLLMRYRRYAYDSVEADTILDYVYASEATTIMHVAIFIGGTDMDKAETIGHVYHLMAKKMILADLSLPLGPDTEIWVNEGYGNQEELA